MTVRRLMGVLGLAAGLVLFGAVTLAHADIVDDLEDIGPDCTPVTTRIIGGVTISTQGGVDMTARTYYDGTCVAFSGHDAGDNAPLNPENVSGQRFISSCGPTPGGCFDEVEPIIFGFDAPLTLFGLTTLDLLEMDCNPGSASLTLRAYNASDVIVDEHTRVGGGKVQVVSTWTGPCRLTRL